MRRQGRAAGPVKRRLVLFDIDGTLLASMGAGRRAILAAMEELVPDHDQIADVRFDGKTDPQIVIELLAACGVADPDDTGRIAAVLERYVACLEAEVAVRGHLIRQLPGVAALLTRLESDRAAVLGLLTGNVQHGARLKLEAAALGFERFVVGAYGSDHADRRCLPAIAAERASSVFGRLPEREELVIIGDTPADVTCGQALGARAIGVATGSYHATELQAAGAWAVFDDLRDADAVLEAILA